MSELVDRARRLAEKHLESELPRRFRHTVAVAERAQQLSTRLLPPQRAEAVVASAWLHDIGYLSRWLAWSHTTLAQCLKHVSAAWTTSWRPTPCPTLRS